MQAGRRSPPLGIARTFQNLGLFVNLDVVDNLMLGRHLRMSTGFFAGALWLGPAKHEEIVNRERCEEIIELLELQALPRTCPSARFPTACRSASSSAGAGHGPDAPPPRRAGRRA